MPSIDFVPSSEAWSTRGLDDVPIDPTLQSATAQYLESLDFAFSVETTLEEESASVATDLYLNSKLDLSLSQAIPTLTEDEGAGVDATEQNNDSDFFLSMRQETMQELSDLNMRLSRQLGAVGSTVNMCADIRTNSRLTALATPPDEKRTFNDVVIFMMHSIQTYHRLLVEILRSARPPHPSRYDSHENLKSSTMGISRLSSIEGDTAEDLNGRMLEATGQPPRKRFRSGRNADSTAPQDLSHNPRIDMPTSLLLLSCHTNLIYNCRDVFAAIRGAISTKNREISLFTISFHNIDSLSIPTDPDLQIIVLIQAVIRMIDKIGRLLGYPDDCETNSGGESNAHSSAIPRRLLDSMLKSEAGADFPADRVGTQALRAEMRQLHNLVYKPL
ncbi:hypothetical protein V2A60_007250 [Cordyceps javanica]